MQMAVPVRRGFVRYCVFGPILLLCALTWIAFGTVVSTASVSASTLDVEPYATWNRTAEVAEVSLRSDRASTSYLERLRARLAEQRTAAASLGQATDVAVRALQAQLDALGPAPADGTAEPEALAGRRAALIAEMAEANAPLVAANAAFQRADVLIAELDRRIRERKTADLLTRYPSAVLVQNWTANATELAQWATTLFAGVVDQRDAPNRPAPTSDGVPMAVALAALGLILLAYGLPAGLRKLETLRRSRPEGARQIWPAFGCAAGRLLVPVAGAACLLLAWRAVEPSAEAMRFLNGAGMEVAIDLILAYWLAHLVFSPTFPPHRILRVDDHAAKRGFWIVIGIGSLSAAEVVLDRLDIHGQLSPDALALTATPFLLASGALLWVLAGVLMAPGHRPAHPASATPEPDGAAVDADIGRQFLTAFGSGLKGLGVLIPLAALVGYVRLSRDVFDAAVQTIALVSLALVLFHAILNATALALRDAKDRSKERKSLLPIILATLLGMALLPLLALVWGAQATDIAEIWRILSDGVQLGDARLSVDGFLTLILVFAVGLVATRWLQTALRTTVLPRTRLDPGARNAVSTGVGYVGITLAAVIAISSAGVNLSNLAIVAGALSVGIGFGMQTIVSNFVSGIILLIERPIKEGDWIEVSGVSGYVRKISVRSTRIETFDRHDVIIPNADLITGTVKNMTLTNATGRVIVPVQIAYGSDVKKAKQIMSEAARHNPLILAYPAPQVLFMDMGDSGLALELRVFLRDINNFLIVRSDLMFEIYTNLREAGIEIPFPQRDIHIRTIRATDTGPEAEPEAMDDLTRVLAKPE